MQTYLKHQQEFGGANRVLVAVVAKSGDMFTPEFFDALKRATDEVFFLPGVDRGRVQSLFTPNVRYTEVVEDGIAAGNVIPDDFSTTPEGLEQVRRNILKAGIVGRLVANDFSGAIISAELLEVDPTTGETARLHQGRQPARGEGPPPVRRRVRAGLAGDRPHHRLRQGHRRHRRRRAKRVMLFFAIAFLLIAVLVALYAQSVRLALVVVLCSLIAVIFQLGLIPLLGYGIDPMSILVPFLVFAIAVSHAVQMVSAARSEVFLGADALSAARIAFRRLLVPGSIALSTDVVGFLTLLVIQIRVIQEIAIAASLGVAMILLTNLVLLPVILSYVRYPEGYRERLEARTRHTAWLWRFLAKSARPKPALVIVLVAAALFAYGWWKGNDVRIGDLHRGVPELRADSRYNQRHRASSPRSSRSASTSSR